MASYTPTNWVAHETLISADRMNNIEQGIASLYPQETIIAPEQTVTITAETTGPGEAITLAAGYTLPEELPEDWIVTVNGNVLSYSNAGVGAKYSYDDNTNIYDVQPISGDLILAVLGDRHSFVPGDYTVEIKRSLPTTMTLPDASGLDDGAYKLEVSNGKWIVQRDLT